MAGRCGCGAGALAGRIERLGQQRGHGELVVAKILGSHGLHLRRRHGAQQRQQAFVGVQRKALDPVAAQFLRLAQAGVYDGMAFHPVVKGFVVQSGHLPTRQEPLGERQQSYIRPLKAEFNDQTHDLGTLSMARTDDPDSATSSFFLVTARAPALDGKYTVFGKVESGIEVVQKIEAVTVNGETPVERVALIRVRVERQ